MRNYVRNAIIKLKNRKLSTKAVINAEIDKTNIRLKVFKKRKMMQLNLINSMEILKNARNVLKLIN